MSDSTCTFLCSPVLSVGSAKEEKAGILGESAWPSVINPLHAADKSTHLSQLKRHSLAVTGSLIFNILQMAVIVKQKAKKSNFVPNSLCKYDCAMTSDSLIHHLLVNFILLLKCFIVLQELFALSYFHWSNPTRNSHWRSSIERIT